MNTKELKINNLIKYKDKVFQIRGVYSQYVYIDEEEDGQFGIHESDENLRTIPITEEILLKSGWKYGNNGCWYYIGQQVILNLRFCSYWKIGIYYDEDSFVDICEIKYVHELQNILFALGFDDNIRV